MCKAPAELSDGTVVACRNCELCRYNRVKDWAGRNIAQAKVSSASFACTLTYGPELDQDRMPIPGRSDHIRTAVLTYSDVQKFLKYLRWLGYPCDYFITGELGSLKSRTHWHIILHFRDAVPTHELGLNFSDRHVNQFGQLFKHPVCAAWPHGFMFWKKAEFQDVFYNCKYILKDDGDEAAQRKPGMSKKPPLGSEYFRRWADLHVDQHLAPQHLLYRHKGINKKDGTPIDFKLSGRTAEMFLERYIAQWKAVHGDLRRPNSQLVDLFEQYGKIVTDEARMLLRQEFPKGESRQAFPSGAEIKRMADEARQELQERREENEKLRIEATDDDWIRRAPDGQERQRRTQQVNFDRFDAQQERDYHFSRYAKAQSQLGWDFVVGKGWVGDSARPDIGVREKFAVWLRANPECHRDGVVVQGDGGGRAGEGLGPVGRFNYHYGAGTGEG